MPPLARGETFATGMYRPRTTALFFDKLWVHAGLIGNTVPSELCVSDPLGVEIYSWGTFYNIAPVALKAYEEEYKNSEYLSKNPEMFWRLITERLDYEREKDFYDKL